MITAAVERRPGRNRTAVGGYTDSEHYAQWLKNSIKLLHEAVRMNKIESKQEMKNYYDKKNRVKEPHYSVGDLVLVKDTRTGRNSDRMLTKKPFAAGPYLVKQVVQTGAAGLAYKVVNVDTGREIKDLITFDRLKKYHIDEHKAKNKFAMGMCILQDEKRNGEQTFLILFENGTTQWCAKNKIGYGLLAEYYKKYIMD